MADRKLRTIALALSLAVTLVEFSCTAPRERSGAAADLPPELARVLRDYETEWRAKDSSALAALFAADGFVLTSGKPPIRGRAAIEAQYAGAGGPLHLDALHWASCGGVAYVIGAYAHAEDAEPVGKFTLTLRRGEDGRWRIVSDMDNANRRAPRN